MSGLLKFITCGSVDDGKSTLIGHILYDAKLLYTDQEKALELDSKVGSRGGAIDYSLLLDGLMAEREQGTDQKTWQNLCINGNQVLCICSKQNGSGRLQRRAFQRNRSTD